MPLDIEIKWLEAFTYRMFDLSALDKFASSNVCSIAQSYNPSSSPGSKFTIELPPFSVQRTLFGSSQAYGQLSVVVTNNRDVDTYALYLETMPWLIQFYLHTMEVHVSGVRRGVLVESSYLL
jgi:hypothetical protein